MPPKISHFIGAAAAVAIPYWLAGMLCRTLASTGTHTMPVWLGAGVIVGALMVAPAGYRLAVLAGALLASYVWGLMRHGLDAAAALPFALIESGCAALGAWVALRASRTGNDLAPAAWLIGGALLTAVLGASLAAEFWRWQRPGAIYGIEWRTWAFSTLVGILLAAPVITAFRAFRVKRSGGMPMVQFWGGAAAFMAFLVIAWVVFGSTVQQRFGSVAATLGYLPMPFLLLGAMIWGPRGGALAMLAGSVLVIARTAAGGGPFAVAEGFTGEAVIEIQAYVAVWAALVLLARDLSESRRIARLRAREWQLRYERILGATGVASVEFDAVSGAAVWGKQAARVLGSEALMLHGVADWHACIEAAERAAAESAWTAVVQGRQPSHNGIYTVRLNGRTLTVQAQLAAVCGPDGAVERVAGLLHPTTPADGRSEHV